MVETYIKRWTLWNSIILLIGFGTSLCSKSLLPLVGLGVVSFLNLINISKPQWNRLSPVFGYANLITLARFILLIIALLSINKLASQLILVILSIFLLLDFCDGFLARKLDQETNFGKYFDMETDAFYVCTISTWYFLDNTLGPWILIVACLRYVNVIVEKILKLDVLADPRFPFAAVIAAAHFIALLSPLFIPKPYYLYALMLTSALVVISFVSVFFLKIKHKV